MTAVGAAPVVVIAPHIRVQLFDVLHQSG